MSKRTELLIVGEDNELYESIHETLKDTFQIKLIEPNQIRSEFRDTQTNLAIVLKNGAESPLDIIPFLLKENPQMSILYIHDGQDFQLLRDVIRAGAIDYLVIPDEMNILADRIHGLATRQAGNAEVAAGGGFKRGNGQVFAFYSGKGGTGKTFLSTAFAQTLKLESTAQVLHIDLNLQYGGAETFLGIDSSRSLIDLKPVIHEINENHIRNISENEPSSKLEVLISPRDAELAESIDGEFVTRLLRACRRSYDFIIIDLPSMIDENSYAALEEADRIYYVITLDTPSIRVLKHAEELFQRLNIVVEERMEIVINEKGRENELTKKDLERFVQYPVAAEIRRDIKGVQAAINQGKPIRTEPKEKKLIPAAKDIHKWVNSMLK
ncbi:AAA family ATPase [Lederbergia citrea]|uniref:AAA family ATPase n=1 Tax=Lederbergia citrea TaxID=2833581 RepID=A0A942Z795_9BACI|nr:AAA family ATPase [Lederbergia citrea]MBS4206168.1 AAA family ATPase [Lederbergia citrea]MBS4224896.1 AAA family ATPase [Lederbergia citrea]